MNSSTPQTQISHILVTTDLSDASFHAFPLGAELARRFCAKVTLLTVVENPTEVLMLSGVDQPIPLAPDLHESMVKRAQKEVSLLAEKYFGGIPHEGVVRHGLGPLYSTILDAAQSLGAQMVVLATHGRTGMKRILLGSVAEAVVRKATIPVMLVPLNG